MIGQHIPAHQPNMASDRPMCSLELSVEDQVATLRSDVVQFPMEVLNRSPLLRKALKDMPEGTVGSKVSIKLPEGVLDAWLNALRYLKVDMRIPDRQRTPKALKPAISRSEFPEKLQVCLKNLYFRWGQRLAP